MIDMNREDISRTYSETYVGINREGNVLPFYVVSSPRRNYLEGVLYHDGEEEHISVNINNEEVNLSYPDSGAYNVADREAVFVSRQAQRQWRRGISQRHLRIVGQRIARLDHRIVRAMYNPSYTGYRAALEVVTPDDREASVAIDKNFWLRRVRKFENPLVWFRSRCIGEIVDNQLKANDETIVELFEEAIRENP